MNRDFRDLLAEFNARGVDYLVVGAIDVITAITDVDFNEAWSDRLRTKFADQPVSVLSRRHLIRNKRATGRTQDLADVERLEENGLPS